MLNINELTNMTAAELRQIESVIKDERKTAVNRAFKKMAEVVKENGGQMSAYAAAKAVGMTPGQVWNCNNKYHRIEAGIEYLAQRQTKTFTCLEDGDTITITCYAPIVRTRKK